eukprot:3723709-Rhodomonas_salina.1
MLRVLPAQVRAVRAPELRREDVLVRRKSPRCTQTPCYLLALTLDTNSTLPTPPANYLVSSANFVHPVSRRPLTRAEVLALDAYLEKHKCGKACVTH